MSNESKTNGQLWFTTKQVATRFGVSMTTVWRWVREGTFVEPVMITKRFKRWPEKAVRDFEARCMAGEFNAPRRTVRRRRTVPIQPRGQA